ncbi:MAG: ABC transporter ATP-binding protein [Spirochaetes bacterium]|nr:ABC transporter ATP-binding protein [Spirochaetota bacterium]MBU1081411.1 ABC transporter ATP-binding protein [Spirochaetota bacterium]
MSVAAMLEARGLSAGYGDRAVVSGAGFSVGPGTLLVVLGPNGCGKTTVLKTCIGLLPALSGEALLGGRPVASLAPRARARLAAWVPQVAESAWSYRARDIVAQGRYSIRGAFRPFDAEDEAAIDGALDEMDARAFADRRFSSLSGGEARRVMIARALAQAAPLLVLDEPAAHLDPGRQMELMELLSSLAEAGKAVAVSAHDVNAARRFADLVLLVGKDGSSAFGPPDEILTPKRLEDAYDTHFIHGDHESYGKFVLPVARKRNLGD